MKEKALIKETGQILDIKENWMKSRVTSSFSFDDLETKEFTLDDTTIPDTIITINDERHYLTKSQLLFIQWIYYTGLYDYLTTTINLKYKILNEMNEEGLFISNVFLRYHMFLCDYEDKTETNKSNSINDNEEIYNLSDSDFGCFSLSPRLFSGISFSFFI